MNNSGAIKFIFTTSAIAISMATGGMASAQEGETADSEIVVVTGQRAQQAAAIEEKRTFLGVVDVASSDEIGRLPDRNVAEVIERLPGVGVQYDQGEGRYVAVRGVPSNLNGYSLNGFEIGNPDGGTRALPLDIISGQLLNRVEVQKVKTADLIGQGIGGTINLVPQTAFDFKRPFIFSANAKIGYQELRKSSQPISGEMSVGGTFGTDDEFGILLGASYSNRTYTSYGLYPDDWFEVDAAARGGSPTNIKYTDYSLKRERIGFAGSLDWKRASTNLYLRGFYSKFSEDEYRQRYRLDFASQAALNSGSLVFNADGVTGTSTATQQRTDLRLEQKEKSIASVMVGGSTSSDRWTLDFGAAYTRNRLQEPNQLWQFRGNPGPVKFDFSNKLYTAVPINGVLAPSSMEFRSYAVQDQQGEEDIWQVRFDAKRDFDLGQESFLKFGANFRWDDKGYDDQSTTYGRGSSGNRFTLNGLSGANVAVYPEAGRAYFIAPTIDADLIQSFTQANLNSARFVLDQAGSLASQTLSDFQIKEDIYAGYAMGNFDFGTAGLTIGLRAEHTKITGNGFTLENGTDVVPATNKGSYTDWLPSAVLRLKPTDDVIVRLAYSRSIGRPNYDDLKPGGALEYALVSDNLYEGSLSLGNANLKPYRANNADVSAEWYFARGGLLSLAGFAKWIDNPIFTRSFTQTNVSFGGRQFSQLDFSQPENADNGQIFGLELAWQQQFTKLPGLLSGLGVNANVTLVSSKLNVPGRSSTDFPEQSNLLFGAQLFYQKGGVEASIGYNQTGRALIGVASAPIDDQFNDNIGRLDAKIAYAINDHITLSVQGQNLTDEPTRQYQGGVKNWVIQQERYGRTFWFGASVRW